MMMKYFFLCHLLCTSCFLFAEDTKLKDHRSSPKKLFEYCIKLLEDDRVEDMIEFAIHPEELEKIRKEKGKYEMVLKRIKMKKTQVLMDMEVLVSSDPSKFKDKEYAHYELKENHIVHLKYTDGQWYLER